MNSKNLLLGVLIVTVLGLGLFVIYNKAGILQKNTTDLTISENIIEENATGNILTNKTYTFSKNMSGDWVTQINELNIKIIVKNDLLKEYCKKQSDFDGCMQLRIDNIDQGVHFDLDGWITTSEDDGSIKILSNITKEEIDKQITANNCVLEDEYETQIILGYSSGVQFISPTINDDYGAQYCEYATNIIVDDTHNKTILIHRSHQDSFLLPNMSVIEHL